MSKARPIEYLHFLPRKRRASNRSISSSPQHSQALTYRCFLQISPHTIWIMRRDATMNKHVDTQEAEESSFSLSLSLDIHV